MPCCGLFGSKNKTDPSEATEAVENPQVPKSTNKPTFAANPFAEKTSSYTATDSRSKSPPAPHVNADSFTEKEPTFGSNVNETPKADISTATNTTGPQILSSNATQELKSPAYEPNSTETMADQLKGAASGVQNTVSSGAQKVTSTAQNPTSGTQDWDAMTEEQKKQTYDSLPSDKKKNLTYYEWIAQGYHNQKENWMPWIEDQYLRWFTKDNKASYATKDAMDKSKVTGIDQVDTLQDSVNHTVSSQVGQGGLLQPVGDMASKEGVNRAERGGKDPSGSYAGAIGGYAQSAGSGVMSGAKGAGSYVTGMFGGGKKEGAAE